jgi:hypothetical protein
VEDPPPHSPPRNMEICAPGTLLHCPWTSSTSTKLKIIGQVKVIIMSQVKLIMMSQVGVGVGMLIMMSQVKLIFTGQVM